jgi:hypothetical protein
VWHIQMASYFIRHEASSSREAHFSLLKKQHVENIPIALDLLRFIWPITIEKRLADEKRHERPAGFASDGQAGRKKDQ